MTIINPYILATGNKGAKRLELLDEIYGPFSHKFLKKIIKPGMSVLDVGCGTGNVTCWLAQQVGDTGRTTGLDVSQDQLDIAKEKTVALNLNNVDFLKCSVYDMDKITLKFDLVYSRFLLIHLDKPLRALELMKSLVKLKGILVCVRRQLALLVALPHEKLNY